MRDEEHHTISLPTGDQAAAQVGAKFLLERIAHDPFLLARVFVESGYITRNAFGWAEEAEPSNNRPRSIVPLIVLGAPNRYNC